MLRRSWGLANISRAVQWLNGSYGIWFNKAHDRVKLLWWTIAVAMGAFARPTGTRLAMHIHVGEQGDALGLAQCLCVQRRSGC